MILCPFYMDIDGHNQDEGTRIEFSAYNHNHEDEPIEKDLIRTDYYLYMLYTDAGQEYTPTMG